MCNWTETDEGIWRTECGNEFEFSEGGLTENMFVFCPFCAGRIDAKPYGEVYDEES